MPDMVRQISLYTCAIQLLCLVASFVPHSLAMRVTSRIASSLVLLTILTIAIIPIARECEDSLKPPSLGFLLLKMAILIAVLTRFRKNGLTFLREDVCVSILCASLYCAFVDLAAAYDCNVSRRTLFLAVSVSLIVYAATARAFGA